jgi:hypothetical protein
VGYPILSSNSYKQRLKFLSTIGAHIQVTLHEREQVCGVFAACLHFGELVNQRVNFIAGEFLVVGHCQHGKRGLHLNFVRRSSKKTSQPGYDSFHHRFDIHPVHLITKQIEQFFRVEAFAFEAAFESEARVVHHFVKGVTIRSHAAGDFVHRNAFDTYGFHHGALTGS